MIERNLQRIKTILADVILIIITFSAMYWAVTVLYEYVFTFMPVYGISMSDTLNPVINGERREGDGVLVSRLSKYDRGDIIVLKSPFPDDDQLLIKRVIATTGDTVIILDGKVFIKYRGETSFRQPVGEGEDYFVIPYSASFSRNTYPIVKEGEVFFLGDNRPVSHDSHSWENDRNYCVKTDDIIGKVVWILPGGSFWNKLFISFPQAT